MPHFNLNMLVFLKRSLIVLSLIFVSTYSQGQADILFQNGKRSNRVNFVYLSDGYTSAELTNFTTNAQTINNWLFATRPFSEYKSFFNSYTIKVASSQSGAKHPGNAADESSSGGQPVSNPNNVFQSTFDYASIHRLLVPQNNTLINSYLATNVPEFDQAFIVVNSPYYGGSGGTFATASTDAASAEVAVHEIGHSFAQLADEYWAGQQYASEKPNMTQVSNPATVKWKNWIGINGTGIYPYGTTAQESVWFRPHQACKMRYLNYPFCPVCTERLIDKIHQLTNMIDSFDPALTTITLSADPASFSITKIPTSPSTISVNWYINGSSTPYATNQETVNIPLSLFNTGTNTLRADVIDNTSMSKSFLPGVGYVNSQTWTLNKLASLPVQLSNFSGTAKEKTGILEWKVERPEDAKTFDIEKGVDGIHFTKLASIAAQPGNSKYTLTDARLFSPVTYYRLKITDKENLVTYSNIIRLQNAFDKWFYKVYQNAESHRYHLTVSLSDNNSKHIAINVTNANGTLVFSKDFGKVSNQLNYDVNLGNKPAGVYFLNINVDNQKYAVQLLAK